MKLFATVALLLASGLVVSASAAERNEAFEALLKKPKREFVNGLLQFPRFQIPSFDIPSLPDLGDITECATAAVSVLDLVDDVTDTCEAVVGGLLDLDLTTDNLELADLQELLTLCGDEDVTECLTAARDLVSAAQDAIEVCYDIAGETLTEAALSTAGINFDEIEAALDAALLQQVLCMSATDVLTCAATLGGFVAENLVSYATCRTELLDQEAECSAECTALAETFVEETGCCATGVVYSLNADFLTENDDDVALTACGVELPTCDELTNLFTENGISF